MPYIYTIIKNDLPSQILPHDYELMHLKHYAWHTKHYYAYQYRPLEPDHFITYLNQNEIKAQLILSHATLFQPNGPQLDLIIHQLRKLKWQPTAYKIQTIDDQFKTIESNQLIDSGNRFIKAENLIAHFNQEQAELKSITFHHFQYQHAQLIIHTNGLIEHQHLKLPKLKHLWSKVINYIKHDQLKAKLKYPIIIDSKTNQFEIPDFNLNGACQESLKLTLKKAKYQIKNKIMPQPVAPHLISDLILTPNQSAYYIQK